MLAAHALGSLDLLDLGLGRASVHPHRRQPSGPHLGLAIPSIAQLCLWPTVSPFVMALPVTLGAPGYDGGDRPG
eukprot:SAG31_NODE_5458_length_2526_cov_1.195715_1_plen_73_part_10